MRAIQRTHTHTSPRLLSRSFAHTSPRLLSFSLSVFRTHVATALLSLSVFTLFAAAAAVADWVIFFSFRSKSARSFAVRPPSPPRRDKPIKDRKILPPDRRHSPPSPPPPPTKYARAYNIYISYRVISYDDDDDDDNILYANDSVFRLRNVFFTRYHRDETDGRVFFFRVRRLISRAAEK